MKRIPSLDGLRAISILLVVVGTWSEAATAVPLFEVSRLPRRSGHSWCYLLCIPFCWLRWRGRTACGSSALPVQLRCDGVAGENQLQPVLVAATFLLRPSLKVRLARTVGAGLRLLVVLFRGATDASNSGEAERTEDHGASVSGSGAQCRIARRADR